ncbi:PREDICTED: macrophage mannose receptor 1-like [Cyprinodon variegatus]|uniref:macrophage mannose receptor 1-like n=1 Tax=Cyprinodon variegatus TaxID=28743 RepID=UPI0007429AD0|nr:PREDICTED: macrophage mannose receptor 1-like [Cyprinodon variegatus]
MRVIWMIFALLLNILQCMASDDSPFKLNNKAGFCLVKHDSICQEIRWTTAGRLLVPGKNKCLGVEGDTVGSKVTFYDCDETSKYQKWECKNETLLALQGQELYVELKADSTAVLSRATGPNSQLTISGTHSGPCTRTHRELFTIEGNAAGRPCMFPFYYNNQWYSDCTSEERPWCAVETKYEHEMWGYCPTNTKDKWIRHPTNGAVYQLNTNSALTWWEAEKSCKQQSASLLSITDPNEQAYITALLEPGGIHQGYKLWTGLTLDSENGWKWTNGSPFRYLNWDSGHPLTNAAFSCGLMDGALRYSWQSSKCNKKLGYICYSEGVLPSPTEGLDMGFCSTPWIPYNGHCFRLDRTGKSWSDAQQTCRKEGGDLASIRNTEDQSFVISQLGYAPTDELWIGLNDIKRERLFDWTDHSKVSFTSWEFGRPAAASDHEDCVLIRGESGNWADRDCKEKHGFVCMKTSASEPSKEEGQQDTGCKVVKPEVSGLGPPISLAKVIEVVKKFLGGKAPGVDEIRPEYLRAVDVIFETAEGKTWFEAQKYCRAIGGDLISFHSAAEQQLERQRYSRYNNLWIGLSAPDQDTGYVWSDGSPVNFQHWQSGEPNNKNKVESCVEFYQRRWDQSGSWNDNQCEGYKGWICQIPTGVTPKSPPPPPTPDYNRTSDGWLEWNGNQYFFETKTMANEDARQSCKEKHGDLVTIDSEAERIFLWKQISKKWGSFWIGLTVDLDKSFQWMDGSPVIFQMWDVDEPSFKNSDENCVVMRTFHGFWHDYNCGYEHKSICKRSGSPHVNATVAPTMPKNGSCQTGWKKMNYKCYKIIKKQNLTWHAARQECQDMNGNLASISSRHEQVYLMSEMVSTPTTDLWIGFHNSYKEGFFWTDGRPKKYINLKFPERSRFPPHLRYRVRDRYTLLRHRDPFMDYEDRYFRMFHSEDVECAVINTNPSLGIGKWIPKSCNDTNGFVCLKDVEPNLQDPSEPTTLDDYFKIINDSIKLVPQQMNWDAAQKNCEADGAKLASIRTEWTQAYIELLALNLNRPLWIGLNKALTNNYFRYIEGWPMTSAYWGPREPRREGNCVYVDVDGKWKADNCNRNISSVCMKSTDTPPKDDTKDYPGICPEDPDQGTSLQRNFWKPYRGFCYLFFSDEKEWPDASTSCLAHGGVLASIADPHEQEFIQSNIGTFKDTHTSYWIGLFKTHKGEWLWSDKTVMDYSNWQSGQPRDNPYGSISASDGSWSTGHRWHDKAYICKTAKVLPPVSSSVPSVDKPLEGRVHPGLIAALVIAGTAVVAGFALFLFKKSGRHIAPISLPGGLTAFDNPLFRNTGLQPDLVDRKKLVGDADEDNTQPVITI